MKDDQEDAFEKILVSQLSRNLDFVKFAETKNAALLTFSSAWILGAVTLLTGQAVLPLGYSIAFCVALPLFAVAGLICIVSFLPRVLSRFHKPEDGEKSLLYWEHIAEVPVGEYNKQVTARYKPVAEHSVTEAYLGDLSVQISVNARVAARKFRMFNVAAWFVFGAIGVLTIPALWWIVASLLRYFGR